MKKNILYSIVSMLLLVSCNYLDYNEKDYLLKDDIYTNLDFVKASLSNVYRYVPAGFNQAGGAMLSSACDESYFADDASAIHKFNNGSWSPIQVLNAEWGSSFDGIRASNELLEEVEKYSYEDYLFDKDPTFDELMVILKRQKYEARALRAYFHFELAKRYGDVPIITRVLTVEEANSIKRVPYQDVIAFIVEECDSAIANLPADYEPLTGKETGRFTKGAAMALKAKALLYAASPLHNPTNDIEKWKAAAKANHDIIESNTYDLSRNYTTIFNNYSSSNTELIFGRREAASNSFERTNFPVGYVGGSSGNCPTQNLVDAYEMSRNGLGINEEGSGYDPEKPYNGRDGRLARTIVYNGIKFKGVEVETFIGGKNAAPLRYATPTGYYLRKYVDESISLEAPSVTKKEHTWVIFRYGEILLNYAEAMNEAYGPDNNAGFTLTATEAVNLVRDRSRVKEFPAGMSSEAFKTKLRNERRVELAFEDQRFWDIRRWKITGDTDIRGVEITETESGLNYNYKTIDTYSFDPKMYLFPIPYSENILNPGLGQNTGW